MSQPQEPSTLAREQIVGDSTQQFLREHLRDVFLAVFCIVGHRAEAQEVTQEAFIGLLQLYPSVTNNRQIGIAVRESAVSSAVQLVRRKAVHDAEADVRMYPRSTADAASTRDSGPEWADSRWGERVVVLLHDTQSFPLQKIASLLGCSRSVVQGALFRARIADLPAGAVPECDARPACAAVINRALSRDCRKLPLRLRLHARKCVVCQRAQTNLHAAAALNRRAALDEIRSLESVLDMASLEREMTGNIAVGVAAARCIQHVYRTQRFTWRVAGMMLALTALFVAGWISHVPSESTARLLRTLNGAFAGNPERGDAVLAGSDGRAVFSQRPSGRALSLLHPDSSVIRVIDHGQIAVTQIAVTWFDAESQELMQQSLLTAAQGTEADVHAPIPISQVRIPAGAPVALEEFSIVPAAKSAPTAAKSFRVKLQLRNTSPKTIAAAAFRASIRGRSLLAPVVLSAQGLQAAERKEFSITGDFSTDARAAAVSVDLALEFVLFSDLTTYGIDSAANRALAADEIAGRAERRYLKRTIDSGHLAAARQELNFGLPVPAAGQFEIRGHPQQNTAQAETVAVPGAPLQIESAQAAAGKLQMTVRNRSARPVAWYEVTVITVDGSGRVLLSEDVPRLTPLKPLGTETLAMEDTVRLEKDSGAVRRAIFVRAAEFADHTWWVADPHVPGQPTAAALDVSTSNPERLRLGALFRRGGLAAVAQELAHGGA